MSMVTLTFENFLCRDCGFLSPGAELKSFSTAAPPPGDFSYDGSCAKCGSSNTTRSGPSDDRDPEINKLSRDKWDSD